MKLPPKHLLKVISNLAALLLLCPSFLFNAASPFFTNGSLTYARAKHTATLLQNGKVLVAGGDIGAPIAISELYDPATGIVITNGTLTTARYQHTATLLLNGEVLVTGGAQLFLIAGLTHVATASAELYDPLSERGRRPGR